MANKKKQWYLVRLGLGKSERTVTLGEFESLLAAQNAAVEKYGSNQVKQVKLSPILPNGTN